MRSSCQIVALADSRRGGGQCQCSAEMFGLPFINTRVHIVRDGDSDRATGIRTRTPPPARQPGLERHFFEFREMTKWKTYLKVCHYSEINSTLMWWPFFWENKYLYKRWKVRENLETEPWEIGLVEKTVKNSYIGWVKKVLLLKGYLFPQSAICQKWLRPRPRRWPGSPREKLAAAGPGLGCPYQLSPARTKHI